MLLHDKQIVALYFHFPPCPLPSTSKVLNMILYKRYSCIVFPTSTTLSMESSTFPSFGLRNFVLSFFALFDESLIHRVCAQRYFSSFVAISTVVIIAKKFMFTPLIKRRNSRPQFISCEALQPFYSPPLAPPEIKLTYFSFPCHLWTGSVCWRWMIPPCLEMIWLKYLLSISDFNEMYEHLL